MTFCPRCGAQLMDNAAFCSRCGTPQANMVQAMPSAPSVPAPFPSPVHTAPLSGSGVVLSLLDREFTVPAELDCFNYFRKRYRLLAKKASEKVHSAYYTYIHSLDEFLERFYIIYRTDRAPLLEEACSTLQQLGFRDVSLESFTQQHTADFCLILEDLDGVVNCFNETAEANRNRRSRKSGTLPGTVFKGGIGSFSKTLALNIRLNENEKNAIAGANVTPEQRAQIFAGINVSNLIDRTFLDYWRIFLSMTFIMKSRGYPVSFPTGADSQRTAEICSHLFNGRIPEDRIPEILAEVLTTFPYNSDFFKYLNSYCGMNNPDVQKINEYFGFDGYEV